MSAAGRGVERIDQDTYETPIWCVQRLLEACPIPPGLYYEPCAARGKIIRAANDFYPGRLTWFANELREEAWTPLAQLLHPTQVSIGSAIDWGEMPFDWIDPFDGIITNPPFSLAFEFLQMALARARFVAFLLRLNFLGSEDRAWFWKQCPPDLYILPNRPCFHVFMKDRYVCKKCKKSVTVVEGSPAPRCKICHRPCERGKTRKKDEDSKSRTTSDATEYAWYVWPEGVRERKRGLITVLDPTSLEVRQAAVQELLAERLLAA